MKVRINHDIYFHQEDFWANHCRENCDIYFETHQMVLFIWYYLFLKNELFRDGTNLFSAILLTFRFPNVGGEFD